MIRFLIATCLIMASHFCNAGIVGFSVEPSTQDPFIAVSFALEGQNREDNGILLRYKTEGGQWSSWTQRPYDEHGATGLNKTFVPPYELPPQTVQLQVWIPGVEGHETIEMHTYYPGKTEGVSSMRYQPHKSGVDSCDCPLPSVESRLDWCPGGTCPQPTYTSTTTTHLIVHHSAGTNTSSDWAAVVRSIWDYHVNFNLWSDIGYNYLIDPNGIIYEGRGEDVVGAHFSCMNTETMGVCLLGNFETANPTTQALAALTELSGWKFCKMEVSGADSSLHTLSDLNLGHLSGHRDGNSSTSPSSCASGTVCPGANLYSELPLLRNEIHDYQIACGDTQHADLVIISMDYRVVSGNTNPLENEPLYLRYTVGNLGDVATADSVTIRARINGLWVDTLRIAALGVGEQYTDSLLTSFSTVDMQRFCVFADADSNENRVLNNSFCITISTVECLLNSPVLGLWRDATLPYTCSLRVSPNDTSLYSYTWFLNEDTLDYGGAVLEPVTALGSYRVILTDGTCTDTTNINVVDNVDGCVNTTSLPEDALQNASVSVRYQQLRVEIDGKPYRLRLFNVLGQTIWQASGRGVLEKDLAMHPSGIYFVHLSSGRSELVRQIVIP